MLGFPVRSSALLQVSFAVPRPSTGDTEATALASLGDKFADAEQKLTEMQLETKRMAAEKLHATQTRKFDMAESFPCD